jgi:hypothetical protein
MHTESLPKKKGKKALERYGGRWEDNIKTGGMV